MGAKTSKLTDQAGNYFNDAAAYKPQIKISRIDILVYVVIIGIGFLEYFLSQHTDFWFDDVNFVERGVSLVRDHFYGICGVPEGNQPPGLPLIFGVMAEIFGETHPLFLHFMAICGTLASLLTYQYLRREETRWRAAGVCVLLVSSPGFFIMATRAIWPAYPYMLAAVGMLIAVQKAEAAGGRHARIWWTFLAAILLAAALMIHSTGLALLAGLFVWTAAGVLINRKIALLRLKMFLPALILGCAVQGWWMHFASPTTGWSLPGYPASYVSQLMIKSGNYPEMGMASTKDLAMRAAHNLYDRARLLTEFVEHQPSAGSWASPVLAGIIILILLGFGNALWRTGGRLMEWYFLCLEGMYLLWPWSLEIRFLMPSAPFALIYAWRGALVLQRFVITTPKVAGIAGLLATSLGVGAPALLRALGWWKPHSFPSALQEGIAAFMWLAIAALSAWLVWKKRPPSIFGSNGNNSRQWGAVAVLVLVVVGLVQQISLGRENLHFAVDEGTFPEVTGAKWIKAYTPPDAVVLARHDTIVYYYARRKTYWFPPLSQPEALLQGIIDHRVNYILVVKHYSPYYLPDDPDCFTPLLTAYPDAFRLVSSGPAYNVYAFKGESMSVQHAHRYREGIAQKPGSAPTQYTR
jgi:hypothetical protein